MEDARSLTASRKIGNVIELSVQSVSEIDVYYASAKDPYMGNDQADEVERKLDDPLVWDNLGRGSPGSRDVEDICYGVEAHHGAVAICQLADLSAIQEIQQIPCPKVGVPVENVGEGTQ